MVPVIIFCVIMGIVACWLWSDLFTSGNNKSNSEKK